MTGKVDGVLKQVWGYSSFRPFQKEAVEAALGGKDALVVLPTGGGKSLCYQLPAACGIGLVLVVSPLIALMDDQVASAREYGLTAGALHSHTPASEKSRLFGELRTGKLGLLYVSPERLVLGDLLEAAGRNLGLLAVDEAHCVSHWGHEFRPEYRQLGMLFERVPGVPRMAFTATATPTVRTDICAQLGLRNPEILVGHPDRPNLIYRAFPRHDQSRQVLEAIHRHHGEGGIVYAQTRKEVDRLAKTLSKAGVNCAPYHAGLDAAHRKRVQDDFVHERLDVVIATIAFGMGIDRSNVRFVVHANTPRSIEHYQQESGRAGRDGEPAECVLLFSFSDLMTHRALSAREAEISPERRRILDRQLKEIGRFAVSPVCRHQLLSEHFGMPYPPEGFPEGDQHDPETPGCAACDVCLGETRALAADEALLAAQKIISAVFRTGNRFGASYVVKVLLGRQDDRILANGHADLRVYGLMKEISEPTLRAWIDQLVLQGFLAVTEGEYPLLKVTPAGFEACKGTSPVRLGLPVPPKERSSKRGKRLALQGAPDSPRFEALRRLRLLIARKLGLPPYVVFHDSVLKTMADLPVPNLEEFRGIKGMGERKLSRFGPIFLKVLEGGDPETLANSFVP